MSIRVLLVDDEPFVRTLAGLALKRLGDMEVIETSNGADALAVAGELSPDLILLDVLMPGLDGVEVFTRLKANASTSSIPVVFLTGRTDAGEIDRLKRLGARAVLAKPFEPSTLVSSVRAAVGEKS